MSTDYTIVCKRNTTPQYKRGQVVIRKQETNETHVAAFQHYCENRQYGFVRYGEESPVRVKLDTIMTVDEWRAMRKEQASIKNTWTAATA